MSRRIIRPPRRSAARSDECRGELISVEHIEIGRILAYVAELDAIDTTDVPPTAHVSGIEPTRNGDVMNTALWIAAGLLAAVLLVSTSKAIVPREKIASVGPAAAWVLDFSPGALRAIAALELLAAAGLILPAVLDIAPILVPVTAVCVAVLFAGAATMRLRRGERATIGPDLFYLGVAVLLAWGRFGPAPFPG